MQPDESVKILGVGSVVLTWLAIAYVMYIAPREHSKSISHHAALNKLPYYIFAGLMTVSMIMMYIFMTDWLVPALHLPMWFTALVAVVISLELVTTWIPLTTGWKYTLHQSCSYGAAALIPLMLVGILGSPIISEAAKLACIGAIVLMVALALVAFFVKAAHERYLFYQSLYIVVFHVALLATIYIV